MRILVKVGGAQLEQAAARQDLAQSVSKAQAAGHEIILVHGGGNQIRQLTQRLGIADQYHQGLRITDAETAEAVLMVLGGQVNRHLVAALDNAVGITGADGGSFKASLLQPDGHDLGYVGAIAQADARLVNLLLQADMVPVIATVAPGTETASKDPHFFNINADHGAGPLAKAFAVQATLFLTDVPGVLDGNKKLLSQLNLDQTKELQENGVIHGGMIPKVQAAAMALAAHPEALVKIAPAAGTDAIQHALLPGTGTRFYGN